jgi:hypothetical protein
VLGDGLQAPIRRGVSYELDPGPWTESHMTPFWQRGEGKKLPKTDRRQAWREVARRVGGTFEEGKRESRDRVALAYGPWTIRLDTYTVNTGQVSITYTRVRAFFIGRVDLKLVIRRRGFFDTILENLGFGGITPGDRELAGRYVVKGRSESRLRSLLTTELTAAILAQPSLRLEVKKAPRKYRKRSGPQARQITMQTTGVIKDPDRLAGMFTVVQEALDALARAGVAAREAIAGV